MALSSTQSDQATKPPSRGKSIVIEGHDGTGKSTQIELLAKRLRNEYGIDSLTIHEPDGPLEECKRLRTKIKDATIPRTAEDNLQWFTQSRHLSNQYGRENYIDKGKWVLRARNHLSTIAYQGGGEGIAEDVILDLTRANTDELYMVPDLTVILFLNDPETRNQRIGQRGPLDKPDTFESKGLAFQKAVNDTYINIAIRDNLPMIDASVSAEAVHEQIMELIWSKGLLPRSRN